MMYLLRKLRWSFYRSSIEQKVMNYCRIEYKPSEVAAAFSEAMRQQEHFYLNGYK